MGSGAEREDGFLATSVLLKSQVIAATNKSREQNCGNFFFAAAAVAVAVAADFWFLLLLLLLLLLPTIPAYQRKPTRLWNPVCVADQNDVVPCEDSLVLAD